MTDELTLADYDGMDFWTAFPGEGWDDPQENAVIDLTSLFEDLLTGFLEQTVEACDRCNTMASCKITGYECAKTGRAP